MIDFDILKEAGTTNERLRAVLSAKLPGKIALDKMPKADAPVHGRIGYHLRTGRHDVTDYDWKQYIAFAGKHFGKK